MRPLSVTWVPSPVAYSSRNAVSFAFAAVFLTAAKALGSSNAMRASFIVDLRDDGSCLPRARARATARGKCAGSQSAKLASSYAQNSQRRAWQQGVCVAAMARCNRCVFCTVLARINVPGGARASGL